MVVDKLNFRNGNGAASTTGGALGLTVNGGLFTGNHTTGGGGAIDDNSQNGLVVSGATFTLNTAVGSGGAIFSDDAPGGPQVTDCAFSRNSASVGGAIDNDAFQATSTLITHNRARGTGGGILDDQVGTPLTNSSVVSNKPDNCQPPNSIAGCTG